MTYTENKKSNAFPEGESSEVANGDRINWGVILIIIVVLGGALLDIYMRIEKDL
jgi:hypothetical protein